MTLICSWNINSVRLRLAAVKQLVEGHQPDILCLQETKVMDDLFPFEALKSLGYAHILFSGEKSYNGVAILSRLPLTLHNKFEIYNQDRRHLSVTFPDGTELHNYYVPAGGDIPDPELNPKFKHKLAFVDHMHEHFKTRDRNQPVIILGDFNIAPLEHDVWSHKQLLSVVSHTPIEVEKLNHLQKTLDWVDTAREFTPHHEKLYSWWSYRNHDWKKSNRGRRLDHIWATPVIKPRLQEFITLKDARDWLTPSDHVPIMLRLQPARG